MDHEHVPVVVIGAGPTGASAAIMLGQRDIGCVILERFANVYPLPRAVHFDDEVFRIFADMDLESEVRAISRPAPGMRITDRDQRVLAEFVRDPNGSVHGFPQANMFDQPELEGVLRDAIRRHPRVELRGGVEVFDIAPLPGGPAPVRVRYRVVDTGAEHEVWADAVLGCDGANSITRGVVGATMEDLHFEQEWLVVDVESPEPLTEYDGVQQVCDHERAATFMPVLDGRYRWEFRMRDGEAADDIDHERVLELIDPWISPAGVDAANLTFLRQATYTFRGLVADRWRNGRVFVLGDAAHQTPPFIGQGMCAGLRDAANLAWKLAMVLDGHAHDRLLDTYECERKPYARRVVQLAIAIGWIMTGGSKRAAGLRRAALRNLTRLPGVEDKVVNGAWPAFRDSALVEQARRACVAGELCPQPSIRLHGEDEKRLDRVLGHGFAIVHRGPDRVAAFDPETRVYFSSLPTTILHADDARDAVLHGLLDDARADAVLIRPDRVFAATGATADLRAWRRQLEAAGIALPAPVGRRSLLPAA